jgi:hypothetical protein
MVLVLGMIGIMYAQVRYGARVFFPKFMLPKRYEYFEDEEPIGVFETGTSNEDCAICLTPLNIKP